MSGGELKLEEVEASLTRWGGVAGEGGPFSRLRWCSISRFEFHVFGYQQ